MDPALAGLLGALIGAISGLAGSVLAAIVQQRSKREDWAADMRVTAYSDALRSLVGAKSYKGSPKGWGANVSDAHFSLTLLSIYAVSAQARANVVEAGQIMSRLNAIETTWDDVPSAVEEAIQLVEAAATIDLRDLM